MFFCYQQKEQKVCGARGVAYLFFITLSLYAALATADSGTEEEMRSLSEERTWQVLMHYRQQGDRYTSLIDDPKFFLMPQGKTNPQAEMNASLQALLQPVDIDDEHFRCRFPARTEWLISVLNLNELALPQPHCNKLNETLTSVDPRSVVLVFPAAHNNGPASMFGHTLLRVGSSYKSPLLSAAVNYAANDTDSNGLLYAFKGIFGFYPGYFALLPYYEKLNDYSGVEHRDIWEYSLNLSPEESRRLMLHTWELQAIASEYYFFDENCSFMLLFLLEAARPELRLAEEYWERRSFWVIPVDTIATIRRAGLITDVTYRPAQATRIRHRASLLTEQGRQRAFSVAMQQEPAHVPTLQQNSPEEERQILDLAAEYVQYRYSRQELPPEEFRPQFLSILKVRSQLGPGAVDVEQMPTPEQPEAGHEAGRISIGGGNEGQGPFLEFSWRPAYHDLLDPDEGYTQGAQINFFALKTRYRLDDQDFRLQSFRPVDILSLAPRDLFFQPISWKVNLGIERLRLADENEPLAFILNTGGGLAWELSAETLGYLMVEGQVNATDQLRENVEIGGGFSIGAISRLHPRWKTHLVASALTYLPERHSHFRLLFDQNFKVTRLSGITIRTNWEERYHRSQLGTTAAFNWYF
ncbi:MAG: hypothetical protein CVU69_11635 [Deltaproteobacteria bacterium HGW-Deltaproteobacteria-4]|nr:MAG: hypothetical protein CVU69_11635 [Deltaproteobacteria bacterium HGW-Deltaproteobacteria-4]